MNRRRLRLELKPSPRVAIGIVALHVLAAACALAVLARLPGALVAGALAALGGIAAWRTAWLGARDAVSALELGETNLAVFLANGASYEAQLAPRCYVGRHLVILPLRWRAHRPVRRSVLVTADMVGGDLFRKLRIWALWGKLPPVAAKQLPT